MDDKKLISALADGGLIPKSDSEKILKEAAALKKPVEQVIYDRHLVDEVELAKVKSKLLDIPYRKISESEINAELLKEVPEETARTYKVIPISRAKDMLVVGMVYPNDPAAQNALRFVAKQQGVSLGVYLVTPSDIDLVLRKYTPFSDEVQAAVQALKLRPGQFESSFSKIIQLESGATVSGEAPIIRIVSALLKEAVGMGASDIHIEPQRTFLRVRFRVDGDLKEVLQLPMELEQPVASRVKVLSNLRIDETRTPQDGRFRTVIYGKEIDFRVATFPTPAGEKVSLRVLDPSIGLKSLTDLGLSDYNIDIIKKEIERPYGMILLTGPTGSGKSTTLYALMQLLNKEDVNIVSLEDPVEYTIDGPNQSQVRPEIGYDFASGLRQILRQDPDIIMVGEIRDGETASLAVHSALTGHLVLSTLHTNNAIGVIPRLVDMKVDSFLLPYTVNLMAAQRLVPRLCQKCKTAREPAAALMKVLKKEIAEMPEWARNKIKEPMKAYYSPGCAACKNKGISGRVAIFEAFTMTPQLADLVAAGINENKIAEEAKRQGMITLRQDGILKALNGLISLEDVLKEGEGVSLV